MIKIKIPVEQEPSVWFLFMIPNSSLFTETKECMLTEYPYSRNNNLRERLRPRHIYYAVKTLYWDPKIFSPLPRRGREECKMWAQESCYECSVKVLSYMGKWMFLWTVWFRKCYLLNLPQAHRLIFGIKTFRDHMAYNTA